MALFRTQRAGFTLLELLVVLAILGGLLGLVAPTIRVDRGEQELQEQAQALRAFLQNAIDDAWINRENFALKRAQQRLTLQTFVDNEWQDGATFSLTDQVMSNISVSSRLLQQGKESLGISDNHIEWLTLSNGEYLPLSWQLSLGDYRVTIVGDGINGLTLE